MMLAKVGMIALVMGAGLVATVSFANAQNIAVVDQKLSVFKQASLGKAGEQPMPVLTVLNNQEGGFLNLTLVKNALRGDPTADAIMKQQGLALQQAIDRRDTAAKELAGAIDALMNANPGNQQVVKRLEEVFDEIQAINKTTNDALLRHDELLALLKEQAAADAQKQ
jgi:hypothetical protein